MASVTVNGTAIEVTSTTSLKLLLEKQGFDLTTIVVAVNDDIVQPDSYAETNLNDSDTIDVMAFVGGG